jgi:hypothetical protein
MGNIKVLEQFIKEHRLERKEGMSIVTVQDIKQLKSEGQSVENLLDYLNQAHQILLHGSQINITDEYLKPNSNGNVYGADKSAIAIMKAIISNRNLTGKGLSYPYCINKNNPLEIHIHGINPKTISEEGFVYVIPDRKNFENNPKDSWQYVKKGIVPIVAQIYISKEDFTYPIIDETNNIRIQ